MSTETITDDAWETITSAAQRRKQRAWVAVAFFGKDGPDLLPLAPGSRLVVNASEDAVKRGLTHPNSLRVMVDNEVVVYSVDNLHAKVFVFGKTAFIGSTNATANSAQVLAEAVVRITDPEAVASAREFVRSLDGIELGPEALRRLQTLYRPPVYLGSRRSVRPTKKRPLRRLHLAHLERCAPPDGSTETEEEGRDDAKSKMEHPRRHELSSFHWHGRCAFRERDQIVQLTKEADGTIRVSAPANVLSTRRWSNGRASCTFVYLEGPKRRRKRLDVVAEQLGRGAKTALRQNGLVRDREFAARLRRLWRD